MKAAGHRRVWRRNDLRRTSDRIEAWLTFVLLTTMLVVGPLAAWLITGNVHRSDARAGDWERHHIFPVTAELLGDPPRPRERAGVGAPAAPSQWTLARWTAPDQSQHTGLVLARLGSRQGSTVPIWVDGRGTVTGPPQHRNPVLDGLAASVLTLGALGAVLYATQRLVVRSLDRRRLDSWQQEWLLVEPRWTHR